MSWPERRLAFQVEYDGTDFAGWQRQADDTPTIQAVLEAAIADVVRHEVAVVGGSRTDAGVHARDQRAAVTLFHPIRPEGLEKALGRRLPASISVRGVRDVPLDFHPRFANGGKTYCYRLYLARRRHPLVDRFAWQVPWALDRGRLAEAALGCLGRHDFVSFASADHSQVTTVRHISRIALTDEANGVMALWIRGDAFLKQMIRNLVGTWVDAARGRLDAGSMGAILAARDRQAAGPTAPGRGLTLERVHPRAPASTTRRD
ncbi:MAG: tRNA pseudouridine(38-40) synthase TruA [Myxococcales bacterium]|nr:tRNA pseudouridine(38-40) synthase TruA [Myxococcales bacterium]MCB9550178.1 tRNA pseudouridine(38-40) synthase TruA [Myxococcales bacterium]